jgi:hypothetical protein
MKKWTLSLVLAFSTAFLYAQNEPKPLRFGIFAGYPLGVFSVPQSGFHLSLNPIYRRNQHWSIESQVSFSTMRFKRNNSFLGHDGGNTLNINVLVGGRVYFVKESRQTRPYFQALVGYGYSKNTEFNANNVLITSNEGPFSFSMGTFLEFKNKFNIGLGLEGASANIVAKIGYTF